MPAERRGCLGIADSTGRGAPSARGRDAAGADQRLGEGGVPSSRCREQNRCEGIPVAKGRELPVGGAGGPGSSLSGRGEQAGTVKGKPIPTGVVTVLRTFTPEVVPEEWLQWALPGSFHRGGGVGGPGLGGARGGRAGRRGRGPAGEALPAGSGEGGGALPGLLLLLKGRAPPWQGGWSEKKEELGQGELTQSLWALLWSRPARGLVPVLLPPASRPRPLLPARRCRFLWRRLSLSHELTAPNGLQLPRCSSSSAPLPAAGLRADGPLCLPSPPPSAHLPPPPSHVHCAGRVPGTLGVCPLAHTPWGWVSV